MGVMNDPLRRWFEYHREDYDAVQSRLAACRNVMQHGREEAARDMLEKSAVHAILSIQTSRGRHERAFTMWATGASIEDACNEVVYSNQKADWLHHNAANADFMGVVSALREDGYEAAHAALVDEAMGLSWTKAGFALAMCGVWELACPDSRTLQELDYGTKRLRTRDDYRDACEAIDGALDADVPRFIKQWVMYDHFAEEHARHLPFFREALGY